MSSSLTSGSQRSYKRAWLVFQQFLDRFYGQAYPNLPISTSCLALFISYLCARQLAPATITTYVSAISYFHKLKGVNDPSKAFLIRKLLTALGRRSSSDIRLPITKNALQELVRSLTHTNSSGWQRSLFKSMFLLAFHGFFRIGELAAKSAQLAVKVLQHGDIQFLSRRGEVIQVKITITQFKHNTMNRPFDIIIDRIELPDFCPVRALQDYLRLRGNKPGPLFCQPDLKAVTVSQFNTELQRCLTFCGLDHNSYKGHIFRIGAACHAAERGLSDTQIRTLGRWKSDAFKIYIRPTSMQTS